jgi:4-hydroxy-3-polyprenylbenzoate decarboxylase
MEWKAFDSLQEFVEACKQIDEWREIEGADWNEEIGALREVTAELIPDPPMLLFDRIKGYPAGFRVVGLLMSSYKRGALALGLPLHLPKAELNRLAAQKLRDIKPIPPVEVTTGPVMENVMSGNEVDLWRFPVPRFHAMDGGRYIGTGDSLINRDPETGYINVGTYRMQVHESNLLGLWMSPGQHGRQICQRYWDQGKSCPVVAVFGEDPLSFMVSHSKIPWGHSELEQIGGLRGRPLEVIKGPITGLPIPAHAEIAIEGEVPPPKEEARDEGPFGEWPGYYSGGTIGTGEPQPVIRVKAIYHRNAPILQGDAPMWPGARRGGLSGGAGRGGVADLARAGIQDVVAVGSHMGYIRVVAIKQRYPGHAQQAARAVASVTRNGRWIVIVDEDIDPTNFSEVLWAMTTRAEPAKDIEILQNCWSTPLDPLMPPDKRDSGDHTNSLAVFYAVRPFHRRDKFPRVSRSPRDLRMKMVEKYKSILPFPAE